MDFFSGERNFFYNFKLTVSSFFSFLLCGSSFRFPMQKQNTAPVIQTLPFSISGLKTLISSQDYQDINQDQEHQNPKLFEDRVIRRVRPGGIISSNLLTRSSSFRSIRSCNLFIDDLIGTESGVCLSTNAEETAEKLTLADSDSDSLCNHRTNRRDFTEQNRRCAAEKQFPPPIPFLAAQAGHRTRPAWILARNCVDGRLILKLERVRDHQSLESHRENGRLILNLVSDDDDQDLQFIEESQGEESIECEEDTDPEIAFKSFTYGGEGGGGMFFHREPFCGVNGNFEERHVVHGHFGSAPLRPMGTVM